MPPVSKISKLPAEIRDWLERAYVEHAFGDIEAVTQELNEIMKRAGVASTIGKSAVGEHSLRIRRAQEAIAATTRSMQVIADTSRDDADKRGEALNAMVSHQMFEALLQASEAGGEDDPTKRITLMNKAALAAGRLTMTSVNQRKFRHDVEKRAKAAADAVAKIAKTGGLTQAQQDEIRNRILGVATPRAAAQGASA